MNKIKYIAAALIAIAGLGLTQQANANLQMSYTTDSQYLIGTVIPPTTSSSGFPGQTDRDVYMANFLLGMNPQTQTTDTFASQFSRTTLPGAGSATATNALPVGGLSGGSGDVTIDLGSGGVYSYLIVTYDGQNGAAAVFNISGLTGPITIYGYGSPQANGNILGSSTPQQGYFRITSYTLVSGTVPDGGATVMLLGVALGALGVARRYLIS
jgi:hypothetical protein